MTNKTIENRPSIEESQLLGQFILDLQEKGIFQRAELSNKKISISLTGEYPHDYPEDTYNFIKDIFETAIETLITQQNKD